MVNVPGAEAPGYWRMSLRDTGWYKQVSYGHKPVCKQVSPWSKKSPAMTLIGPFWPLRRERAVSLISIKPPRP